MNSLKILVGTVTLSSGGNLLNVQKFILHPNFQQTSRYIVNDVALIKLTSAINYNVNMRALDLASSTPGAGARATVIGWGLNENGVIPNRLQYLPVNIVSLQTCAARNYPVVPSGPQVCAVAVTRTSGVCNGDSGSALIYGNTQIGIVSWGTGGCANGRPTGYTSVAGFRSWILNTMNSN